LQQTISQAPQSSEKIKSTNSDKIALLKNKVDIAIMICEPLVEENKGDFRDCNVNLEVSPDFQSEISRFKEMLTLMQMDITFKIEIATHNNLMEVLQQKIPIIQLYCNADYDYNLKVPYLCLEDESGRLFKCTSKFIQQSLQKSSPSQLILLNTWHSDPAC